MKIQAMNFKEVKKQDAPAVPDIPNVPDVPGKKPDAVSSIRRRQSGAFACPHCRSRASRIDETRSRPGRVNRDRVCIRCGQRYKTVETVV